jgi:hypothetical protein
VPFTSATGSRITSPLVTSSGIFGSAWNGWVDSIAVAEDPSAPPAVNASVKTRKLVTASLVANETVACPVFSSVLTAAFQ